MNTGKVEIQNMPRYALEEDYIVARASQGELWFFGNYPEEKARRVAIAVDGIVVKVGTAV